MFSLFGQVVSAIYPIVLVAAPFALGLLVYVFRRSGKSNTSVVSSLFLLRELPQILPSRKKFIPPLQFWIELIAFLTLISAAAGIFAKNAGQNIAIIIDTSFSMSAINENGESRLTVAKKAASAHIREVISDTKFSLFSASSTLKRISNENTSIASIVSLIDP